MSEPICQTCNGTGEIPCQGCSDLKRSEKIQDKKYGRKDWSSCARCHGRGTLTCPKCKGSGKVA